MKYAITALFFIILFNLLAYSQPYGWFTLSSGTANNLNGVSFPYANSGNWHISWDGKIFKRVYFYRAEAYGLSGQKGINETRKMVLIK
jgi:hypothetical protein